jgi:hypothetical protein
MIVPLLRKDWQLLAPMVALVVGIQMALEIAIRAGGLLEGSAVALELQRPLTIAWFLSIAALTIATVQVDPLPGADQDWLVRPIRRRDLLLEKMVFLLLAVFVPMLVINTVHVLSEGFSLAAVLGPLLLKDAYLLAFFVLPVAALAATTRSMTDLALQGAALLVLYVAGTALAALVLAEHRCPTCETGLAWMEHLVQHTVTFLGAAVILWMQYRRRATGAARALAFAGAALLAFVQVPWSAGFALQRALDAGEPSTLALAPAAGPPEPPQTPTEHAITGRQASRALWRGEVDPALEYLAHRPDRAAGMQLIEVPLRIEGLAPAAMLLSDRLEVGVLDALGAVRYHALVPYSPGALKARADTAGESAYAVAQTLELPRPPPGAKAPVLTLHYWLTVLEPVAQVRLPARHGEVRLPGIGRCATDADAGTLSVRCEQVGRAPYCYRAVLEEEAGSAPLEALKCWPDYRPYGAMLNALSFYGLDLPLRGDAHRSAGLDPSRLAHAIVLVRFYGNARHIERVVRTGEYRALE